VLLPRKHIDAVVLIWTPDSHYRRAEAYQCLRAAAIRYPTAESDMVHNVQYSSHRTYKYNKYLYYSNLLVGTGTRTVEQAEGSAVAGGRTDKRPFSRP